MDPTDVAIVACELKKNILGDIFPNLQSGQPEKQVHFAGTPKQPRRERTKSAPYPNGKDYANIQKNTLRSPFQNGKNHANFHRNSHGRVFHRLENEQEDNRRLKQQPGRGRGRGSKNGFDKGPGVGRGLIQVGSSVAGDASKPTSEKLKERGQDLLGKFVEEQLKNIKITNVEEQLKTDPKITKFVESKRYNLRGGASNDYDTEADAKETVSNDDATLETSFKKPNLANITIAQLMPHLVAAGNVKEEPTGSNIENCEMNTPVKKAVSRKDKLDEVNFKISNLANAVSCASPVAGGNLKAKATPISAAMPRSPPKSTSTMSSTDMSLKLRDVCDDISKLMNTTEVTKSILKPSGASVEKLERYESGGRNGPPFAGTVEEYRSRDAQFMPISLSMGQEHLFVTSQSTNQVQVFQSGQQLGVLKIKKSKFFNSLRNVHTITREISEATEPDVVHQVVVLDNTGFHFFVENGLFIYTILAGESHQYRGLGHIHYQGKFCLVSLDVKDPNHSGVSVVIIDVEKGSKAKGTILKRIKIPETEGMTDEQTKCRFLTVTPDEKKVYVTSLMLNKIFSINMVKDDIKTFDRGIKEPAGIAIDPRSNNIFVSSRGKKSVEVFNCDLGYSGQFLHQQDKVPIGLCVHDNNLYVATNENFAIMKVPIKYGK